MDTQVRNLGTTDTSFGMLSGSPAWDWITKIAIPIVNRLPNQNNCDEFKIGEHYWKIALPITFTPFASAKPCSARCRFCSESLVHQEANRVSASLRPGRHYFELLADTLSKLQSVPLGLSLSGLELTNDFQWAIQLLAVLKDHEDSGGLIQNKCLYSNGTGFVDSASGNELITHFVRFGLDRIELSRHHYNERANTDIMRFRDNIDISSQGIFEDMVKKCLNHFHVRLTCVVQKGGIDHQKKIENYLRWAWSLGVRDVVFRELARTGENFLQNSTLNYIAKHRIPIEYFIEPIINSISNSAQTYLSTAATVGYYYWNLCTIYQQDMKVTFETSDYSAMKARHKSGIIYKLVFHANGALTSDWDPDREIILKGENDG